MTSAQSKNKTAEASTNYINFKIGIDAFDIDLI